MTLANNSRSATIVVKIKNQGEGAYMPNEYGDTIIVERHFNKAGTSGFKLKSANGRIISTKRADLDDICDYFALQIDNPMNVLSQDNARQFITSSSPQDKYKFFVRGVQLEQLDHDYGVLEETIDNIESKLGTRHDDIQVLKIAADEAKHKLDQSDKQEVYRERMRVWTRQMAWAQVEEQEKVCLLCHRQCGAPYLLVIYRFAMKRWRKCTSMTNSLLTPKMRLGNTTTSLRRLSEHLNWLPKPQKSPTPIFRLFKTAKLRSRLNMTGLRRIRWTHRLH
jgi:hypothetical protein